MDWIYNRAIAHRGLHDNTSVPENSRKAFQAAIEHNYPVELDIQLLCDGNLVVFHDLTLERMTGVPGKIQEQTISSLRDLRLLNTEQKIPLLEEVLDLIAGQVPILIEIKNEGTVGKLEAILREKLQNYQGDLAIASFNPHSLGWFKENAPEVIRGQLSTNFTNPQLSWYRRFLLSNLLFNGVSRPHFIAYDLRFLPNLSTAIAKRVFGLPIVAWTVKNEADRDWAGQYADNIIFEQ